MLVRLEHLLGLRVVPSVAWMQDRKDLSSFRVASRCPATLTNPVRKPRSLQEPLARNNPMDRIIRCKTLRPTVRDGVIKASRRGGSGPAPRDRLSLARNDCSLSKASAARLTLLPYLFGATLDFSSSPFGLELPSSVAFFTPPGHVRRSKPVAVFKAQSSQNSIQPSLPFRTFIPPDRSARSAASSEKLTFVPGPFSLRSPPASITFDNYPLPDHRFRFATVYQALLRRRLSVRS